MLENKIVDLNRTTKVEVKYSLDNGHCTIEEVWYEDTDIYPVLKVVADSWLWDVKEDIETIW